MSASIAASLVGEPPFIVLTRTDVATPLWYEIELTLPGTERDAGDRLRVPPGSLVENRRRLQDLLLDSQTRLVADDDVRELVARGAQDDQGFSQVLAADGEPDLIDLEEALQGGPHVVIRDLRDFQQENLAKLASLRHGANFSVPGAGKTTVAYALHALMKATGEVTKLLVVAPLSAYGAWEEDAVEVLDPAPRVARMDSNVVPTADVVLVNYQRLPTALPALTAWALRHRVHMVLDEAHRAKRGLSGEWGRAVMTLAPVVVRRDILTGTPAPNHPRDLVALLDFLWPSKRASARIPRPALATEPSTAAVRQVSEAIEPFFVRTNKARLQLPDVTVVETPIEIDDLQRGIYEALKNRYAGHLSLDAQDAANFARMGEVSMYLLQAASSPRLLRGSADPARAYRFPPLAIPTGSRLAQMVEDYADHEVPAKVLAACQIVSANADQNKKTLLWSNFPDNLTDLQVQLAGLQPAVVFGGIPSADEDSAAPGVVTREREIARFRNDPNCMVLLANPAALSEGVSLHHTCHDAVYLDRTFNAGHYLQSLDRIHRLGLGPDVETNVTLLVATDTVDEQVNRRVAAKTRRLGEMLADDHLAQMALPDEDDGVVFLDSHEDVVELLRHLGAPSADD